MGLFLCEPNNVPLSPFLYRPFVSLSHGGGEVKGSENTHFNLHCDDLGHDHVTESGEPGGRRRQIFISFFK